MSSVLACSASPGLFIEATQKGHEVDSAVIPILQMGKSGLREELTDPKPSSLEVAKSGLEPRVVCCQIFHSWPLLLQGVSWIYSHLYPCQAVHLPMQQAPTEAWQDLEALQAQVLAFRVK